MKKKIRLLIILAAVISAIFLAANFTKIGYMSMIKYHGFKEVRDNIFIDKNYLDEEDQVLSMIDSANERNEAFFGELQGETVIIITDDKEKLNKLGNSGSTAFTTTYVVNGAHNFTVVSGEKAELDILAHELSHAEIHSRIYKGKWSSKDILPVWFDEGLAMQNDYRDKYSESEFKKIDNVRDITTVNDEEFFDSNKDIRVENYILAKHTVSCWIDAKGKEEVSKLLDAINKGENWNLINKVRSNIPCFSF